MVQRRPRSTRLGASSSIRSHSCSAARRPMAASSTDRTAPVRWAAACPMQPTPHCNVFATSHQCSASRSTGLPPAASYAPTSWSMVPSPPTSSGAPKRHAFTHSQPRSSSGSPTWTSSQSMAAASPSASTMMLPRRKSPCTNVVAVRDGRLVDEPLVRLLERGTAIFDHAVRVPVLREAVGVGRARHLGRIDGVQSGQELAEIVDEPRARARTRPRAESCERGSRPVRAPSRDRRCRAVCRRRRRARRERAARRGRTLASRPPRYASTPARPGRPGGSRRRIRSSPLAVNDHVSRDAPPVRRRSSAMLTGAPEHGLERRLESVRLPALIPTGMSLTIWSRYSESRRRCGLRTSIASSPR